MEKAEEFRAETAENSPYGQKGFPAFTAWNPFHLHVADKYYRFILLLIPLLHSGVMLYQIMIPETSFHMVINHPAGLEMGVNRDRTQVLETAFPQILAELPGQGVLSRDFSLLMACVENGLSPGKAPYVRAE